MVKSMRGSGGARTAKTGKVSEHLPGGQVRVYVLLLLLLLATL
jgi:hypothetical protein